MSTSGPRLPRDELRIRFVRSSGPGGQNVNKRSTKAELHWDVVNSTAVAPGVRERFLARFGSRLTQQGVLILRSQEHRDPTRNAQDCMDRLRRMLAEVARPPRTRRATRPTRASKERRLDSKRRRSQTKQTRTRPPSDD